MLKRAYVFPGQGSQSVGMLSDIAQAYPEIEHIFNQASNISQLACFTVSLIFKQHIWF